MANRDNDTGRDNGTFTPNGTNGTSSAAGVGTAGTGNVRPGQASMTGEEAGGSASWNQGYQGSSNVGQTQTASRSPRGRFFSSAMERIGETRGQRAPGEIGGGRGMGTSGDEDPRRRITHFNDAPMGSYGVDRGPGRDMGGYGASGQYLGGNLGGGGGSSTGEREGGWSARSGSMVDDRSRAGGYRGFDTREDVRDRGFGRDQDRTRWAGGRTGGDDDRSFRRDLGDSVDRYGYFGMADEGRGEVRSRWLKEPLAARDVMTRNPKTVGAQTTLREAAMIMRDEDTGIVPVVSGDGRLLGVLTDRDMVVRAFAFDRVPGQMRVEEIMSDDVECVTADESIHDVLELMGRKQIRRVPVVDREDRLIGILSMGDIAQKADTNEELQEALHRISGRRSFWSRLFS